MQPLKKIILLSISVLSIIGVGMFALLPIETDDQSATAIKTETKNMIKMTTSLGTIDIELYPEEAPQTVENFLKYVENQHFNGMIFHRVIPGFMIQGGGFMPDMQQRDTQPTIKNEADNGLKNTLGTLAMARTSAPDSASSQFFINLADNKFLDFTAKTQQGWGYTVFAKVVNGMDVVEQIGKVATGNVGGHGDVPLEPVVIEKVEVITNP